jgi:tRNA A-37 threonylcarbamoyl transferase component Bud32/class 3 adenylate cyclase
LRFLLLTLLRILQFAVDVIGWGLILVLGLRVWCVVSPTAGINKLGIVAALKERLDPNLTMLGSWIGARWPMTSGPGRFFPLALALLGWGALIVVRRAVDRMRFQVIEAADVVRSARRVRKAEDEESVSTASGKDRDKLLQQYREIEKKLHTARRLRCAFLNIDVVGSTKMKAGESLTNIAASFQAYEEMLRKIFQTRKAWKQSWTPDGVLICFQELNPAVRAAQDVVLSLKQFNSTENRLRVPFRVRCGIGEGEVAIFDDTNLSTFSDPAVDTAAHMQKDARPNALCLGEDAWGALADQTGFYMTGRSVDQRNVFEWSTEPPLQPQESLVGAAYATPTPTPTPPLSSQPGAAPRSVVPQPFIAPRADTSFEPTIVTSPTAAQSTRTIGRYEIVEELGRGAMGAVYKARDPQIGRTVALKVILSRGLMSDEMRTQKERFYREARAAGKLLHPGIVAVYDVAEDAHGSPYLVMEYVEGTTLDKAMSPGGPAQSYTFAQRLGLAIEIAGALDYAHRNGVIHRDIKPANILMTRDGHPKIADFGIAKLIGTQATIGGALLGTPAFVSPEQLTGAAADARSDIFSLGVMLYWLFTGERPFSGDTLTAVSYKVMHTTPTPARQLNWALPEELDKILSRAMAKDPGARFQTAAEFAAALQSLRDSRS